MLAASILAVTCTTIAHQFSKMVPEPYMDEIFHVPQVQQYCVMNFSYWDPMITTPPGLYLFSYMWIYPLSLILNVPTSDLCTVTFLRAQNVMSTLLLFFVLRSLLKDIHGNRQSYYLLSALTISSFPLIFFFSFLYYTDVGATLLVLLGYSLATRGNHLTAAMVLFSSLSYRQTSIVWVVFVAGTVALCTVERKCPTTSCNVKYLKSFVLTTIRLTPTLLFTLSPYIMVAAIFLACVYANGSLALGDKTNHTLSLHLPQILYFAVFACFFSSPLLLPLSLLDSTRRGRLFRCLFRWSKWKVASVLVLVVLVSGMVHYFTYAHPYLLADNRHYPFYIWKNIYRRHSIIKYLLVPLYIISASFILHTLAYSQTAMWIVLYVICCFVSLVPQKLIEFRYFILPYLMFRIHVGSGGGGGSSSNGTSGGGGGGGGGRPYFLGLLAELCCYGAVNVLTILLFLYKPFHWPDSSDWQRFMW